MYIWVYVRVYSMGGTHECNVDADSRTFETHGTYLYNMHYHKTHQHMHVHVHCTKYMYMYMYMHICFMLP